MKTNIVTLEQLLPVMEEILSAGGEVTFTPNGNSMYPMLKSGVDTVTLKKVSGPYKKYDLPLYRRRDGSFVLHRIVGAKQSGYVMRGDNQLENEYYVEQDRIIALVVAFCKNGKTVSVNSFLYRLYCILRCGEVMVILRKTKRFIKRKLNKKGIR